MGRAAAGRAAAGRASVQSERSERAFRASSIQSERSERAFRARVQSEIEASPAREEHASFMAVQKGGRK